MEKFVVKTKQQLIEIIKVSPVDADLNHLDVSQLTDFHAVFHNSDFNGNISEWDVSNAVDMSDMFLGSDFNGIISKWDVSNVKTMGYMFCNSKFNRDISKWNVGNVKNMSLMFCMSEFDGDISQWDVRSVENMNGMFNRSVFTGDISNWDVSNVRLMERMFESSQFNGDISKWNVSNVIYMNRMFSYSDFNNHTLNWKLRPNCKTFEMFDGTIGNSITSTQEEPQVEKIVITSTKQLKDIVKYSKPDANLNHLDVSGLTDLSYVFNKTIFNGDISEWDVSNVTTMECTFFQSKFNGDISKWDVSSVTNMIGMFAESEFTGDISNWDVRNVENMNGMFSWALFDGDISKWDTSKLVTNRNMFLNEHINSKTVSEWAHVNKPRNRNVPPKQVETPKEPKRKFSKLEDFRCNETYTNMLQTCSLSLDSNLDSDVLNWWNSRPFGKTTKDNEMENIQTAPTESSVQIIDQGQYLNFPKTNFDSDAGSVDEYYSKQFNDEPAFSLKIIPANEHTIGYPLFEKISVLRTQDYSNFEIEGIKIYVRPLKLHEDFDGYYQLVGNVNNRYINLSHAMSIEHLGMYIRQCGFSSETDIEKSISDYMTVKVYMDILNDFPVEEKYKSTRSD